MKFVHAMFILTILCLGSVVVSVIIHAGAFTNAELTFHLALTVVALVCTGLGALGYYSVYLDEKYARENK